MTEGSRFPCCPGGILTISPHDFIDSSCDAGGGEQMPSSSVAGWRIYGVTAHASVVALISASSSLPFRSA